MPRIRSIKPEFASDRNNLQMSDSCAMFYVLLWMFCDDEGKIQNEPLTISKLVCRWNQDKVKKFVSYLLAHGQLRLSSCSAWVQVVNWSHQRINRVIQPKIKTEEIQWLDAVSPTAQSRPTHCLDTAGSRIMDHGSKDHGVDGAATSPEELESLFADTKNATGAHDAESQDAAPAAQEGKECCGVIDELRGDALVEQVLTRISHQTQRNWIRKYEPEWLKAKLFDAILHHTESAKVLTPLEINDWGRRLTGWIRREKKPRLVNPGFNGGMSEDLSKLSPAQLEEIFPSAPKEVRP